MKTVSTKLDSKLHEHLINLANKDGTTVSDILRDMVDGLVQNEGVLDETRSDDDRRIEIDGLQSEMDKMSRLIDQSISDQQRRQYLEQCWKLEDKLSDLLTEEANILENSLLDILGRKSWFSNVDEFLDFIKRHDIPLLEALDDAIDCYLEYRKKTDSDKISFKPHVCKN
jgi:hypothetical protein